MNFSSPPGSRKILDVKAGMEEQRKRCQTERAICAAIFPALYREVQGWSPKVIIAGAEYQRTRIHEESWIGETHRRAVEIIPAVHGTTIKAFTIIKDQ